MTPDTIKITNREEDNWVQEKLGIVLRSRRNLSRPFLQEILTDVGRRTYISQLEDFSPEENYLKLERLNEFPEKTVTYYLRKIKAADIHGYVAVEIMQYLRNRRKVA
ncbi:MAG: hypothetical protein WCI72_04855 [archaeon]